MNRPSYGRLRVVFGALLVVILASGCSHRSVENISGSLSFGPEIKKIRIELENGTLDVALPNDGTSPQEISYVGGLRRDASSAEGLTALEAVSASLSASADPEDASTLVIRGPHAPAGTHGMIAFEGNVRVPGGMPLEVVVRNNGHVTMRGRRAFSKVRTRRGDLRFEACRGGVEANTGQGIVIAFDHRGDLDVRTGLGDMQVFILEAGDILTLSTGKGTVQCHVPDDIEFDVDARVEIGRIGSDFGLEVKKIGDYSAAMTGRRGSGRTKVILRTAHGHISLIRPKG